MVKQLLLAAFSITLTMFGLCAWATPNLLRCFGDEGVGPLSSALDETILNKRHKVCKTWTAIGIICIMSGFMLLYAVCY